MNLYFLKYNNYFNRVYKKHATLQEYISEDPTLIRTESSNFNPNNGVQTSAYVNFDPLMNSFDKNYMLVVQDSVIISRWFICEKVFTRLGQYQLTLRRDVIADFRDVIDESPCFIEKATIQNPEDVAIYNSEQLELNKIKKRETLLKDRTGCSWMVGYFAKNINNYEEGGTEPKEIEFEVNKRNVTSYAVAGIQNWEYYIFTNMSSTTRYIYKGLPIISCAMHKNNDVSQNINTHTFKFGTNEMRSTIYPYNTTIGFETNFDGQTFKNYFNAYNMRAVNTFYDVKNNISNSDIYTNEDIEKFVNSKYIYDTVTEKLYRIDKIASTKEFTPSEMLITAGDSMDLALRSVVKHDLGERVTVNPTSVNSSFSATLIATKYYFSLVEVQTGNWKLSEGFKRTDPEDSDTLISNTLKDAPYGMFAIPVGSLTLTNNLGMPSSTFTLDAIMAQSLSISIAKYLGGTSGFIYDIQWLPFCPLHNLVNDLNQLNVGGMIVDKDYSFILDSSNNKKGVIFYCDLSSFSFDISTSISAGYNVLDKKKILQCDSYRLCSPNYAAVFEFNPVKTGDISKINVDCTYKPFMPYIHLNPIWGNLYGQDYNDTRGLIVQGDFSLPMVNDQWETYQVQNKNYLNTFNRQIESIELQNKWAERGDLASAISGNISGAASGAISGFAVGGVPGAIAGGVIGGVASGIGGALDIISQKQLRRDNLDLTKDMFNYNIGNIQALPNTIAKVSSFDYNNKIFPVLEYYTCTEQEVEIFKDKLKYNGMTIMHIGKPSDYNGSSYFKAKLIRLATLSEDFALTNAIANELDLGIYEVTE